jgi:hypothetical protein
MIEHGGEIEAAAAGLGKDLARHRLRISASVPSPAIQPSRNS